MPDQKPERWVLERNSLGCVIGVRVGNSVYGSPPCDPFAGGHPHDDPVARLMAHSEEMLVALRDIRNAAIEFMSLTAYLIEDEDRETHDAIAALRERTKEVGKLIGRATEVRRA